MLTYSAPVDVTTLRPEALATELRVALEFALAEQLTPFTNETAALREAAGKWSAKEILGHLLDSCNNNLQRIVRLSIDEELTMPGYKQNEWVAVQHYQERQWSDLVILWMAQNLHLAHVIAHTDPAHYTRVWRYGQENVTLGFLMHDYIGHMRHHLQNMPKLPSMPKSIMPKVV